MNCKCSCGYIGLLVAIFAGVLAGILYATGFIAVGVVFWAYLAVGVLGLLLTPLYATESCRCFFRYRTKILIAAIGTVIAAVVGLIAAPFVATTLVAVILGVATLFTVLLLSLTVCLSQCLCDD